MLEVKIPGTRVGTSFAGEALTKGGWVRPSGTFSQGDLDTIHATYPAFKNAAGYATLGADKVMRSVPGDTIPSFPVNKLELQPEDADNDNILEGEGVIYYEGVGQYETDQMTSVSGTGAVSGNFLKIGETGKLVEEASPDTVTTASVAQVVRMTQGIRTRDGAYVDRVWFRRMPK